MAFRAWAGSTEGLISRDEAEAIAIRYGRKKKLAPFFVDFAELINRKGEPDWFVVLSFVDDDATLTGLPSCVVIHVHARTGIPENIQSL